MQKHLLELKDISLFYQTKKFEVNAIDNLSFYVDDGEFVSIIGASGCGKTSILSIIAGLIKATKGYVTLNGKSLNKTNLPIGYMLQKDNLFPWLTIEQNACLPLKIKKIYSKENRQYVINLLDKYGLKDFKNNYPKELSGGMRQRVALIRTLSFKPQILLLDEPFSALDYQTRLNVCDDVYAIIKKEKKTAILVTHDISEAISVSDRIIVLSKRPAKILSENIIDLDNLIPPLQRRESQKFSKWFEILWGQLNI